MQLYGAKTTLRGQTALGASLLNLGLCLLERGAKPARPRQRQDQPAPFLAHQIITPWLSAAKLPGVFTVETHKHRSAAYGFLDLDYDCPRLSLHPAAQHWGHAFVAALLPLLHVAAQHICPLISPVNAGEELLGMFGDYTQPKEHKDIMAHLREFHGLKGSAKRIEKLLDHQGVPTPTALLREFEPYLTTPCTLFDLRELAGALDASAVTLVDALEDLINLQLPVVWNMELDHMWHHPVLSDDGADPVGLVLTPSDTATDARGWCEHALDRRLHESFETGLRPLWLWDLDEPEQQRQFLHFTQIVPELGAHWQTVTGLLASPSGVARTRA
ncbi:hypothetical protein Dxin01_00807 [Deinococcus xinjiangensis]|uniref:Uncharacterized protein n=1 Tax=Deinococcus xinjiangensis TaxID=457454 RepID=A0ABP9V776_9DEIO